MYSLMVKEMKHEWISLFLLILSPGPGVLGQGGPPSPDNTVQVCYNNQLSVVDRAYGQLNFPGLTGSKSCLCTVALTGVANDTESAILQVTMLQRTPTNELSTCRTKLQVFTPTGTYRLLCTYPIDNFFDLPIYTYERRMSFVQDGGSFQLQFQIIEGPGTALIRCSGDPLPSTRPPTTRPPGPTTRPPDPTTRPPDPTTRPPSPTTRPPGPTTRPPGPTTRPPGPTTRPPDPTTRPPGPTKRPPGPATGPPGSTTVPGSTKRQPPIRPDTTEPAPKHCPVHDKKPSTDLLFRSYMEEVFFRAIMTCTCMSNRDKLKDRAEYDTSWGDTPPRSRHSAKTSILTVLWFAHRK